MSYDEDTLRWAISHTARLREYAEMARKRAAEYDARADRVEQTYDINRAPWNGKRARIWAGSHTGQVAVLFDRRDPRVAAHPQPGHQNWECFAFFSDELTGDPEKDGHGIGYRLAEVEILP